MFQHNQKSISARVVKQSWWADTLHMGHDDVHFVAVAVPDRIPAVYPATLDQSLLSEFSGARRRWPSTLSSRVQGVWYLNIVVAPLWGWRPHRCCRRPTVCMSVVIIVTGACPHCRHRYRLYGYHILVKCLPSQTALFESSSLFGNKVVAARPLSSSINT